MSATGPADQPATILPGWPCSGRARDGGTRPVRPSRQHRSGPPVTGTPVADAAQPPTVSTVTGRVAGELRPANQPPATRGEVLDAAVRPPVASTLRPCRVRPAR